MSEETDMPARDEGPRFAYAMDTLLMEVGRLNRVIRRLQESPTPDPSERADRSAVITRLMERIVEIFEAIDALGTAQGGEDEPSNEE
ncbi:MAG TPA: hypothetical protein VF710_22050 [Longimicrobium sp.]|jgi:hypothetical protein